MSTHPRSPRVRPDWLSPVLGVLVVIAAGVIIGLQYVSPDKRMLAVIGAGIVLGIAWRLDLVSAIGLLVLALPYPREVVFGSTNLAMVMLLLIIWLLRVNTGSGAPPRRSRLDVPIIGLVIAYIISFYSITRAEHIGPALSNTYTLLACVAIYYLIVNNVRTSNDLARIHRFQIASILSICLLGLYEIVNPGGVVIPGWIYFRNVAPGATLMHNIRIGGPFFDFEQFSDWSALTLLFVGFLIVRSTSTTRRLLATGLGLLVAFMLFATVTRGAIIALMLGVVYLAWLSRTRLNFISVVSGAALILAIILGMNYFVSNYTHSGDMLGRLLDPQTFEVRDGLPEGRAVIWEQAFERMMQHPIIGHGPFYALQRGTTFWYWPHNLYLYLGNLVGIVGLTFFVMILVMLFRALRPVPGDLSRMSHAQAYLLFARVQLVVFAIDQTKIEYLRNPMYPYLVWAMFGLMVAASQIAEEERRGAVPA
ncbi:MAG: O-antigen ligase family protein [Candidatus Eisenbacteria bacterium]|uniref:O-antigen ligase family protein n=1 Tax=Eiseniibacteriota bacterium TaxID=2212470 RepID=A0A849SPT8_UNCEI|nr:O-antigen ligase family protein [Candidatus Eisenbacteria bacterium]